MRNTLLGAVIVILFKSCYERVRLPECRDVELPEWPSMEMIWVRACGRAARQTQ